MMDYERNFSPETAPRPQPKPKRPTFKGFQNAKAGVEGGGDPAQTEAVAKVPSEPSKAEAAAPKVAVKSPAVDLTDVSEGLLATKTLYVDEIKFRDGKGLQPALDKIRGQLTSLAGSVRGLKDLGPESSPSKVKEVAGQLGDLRTKLNGVLEEQRRATPNKPHILKLKAGLESLDRAVKSFEAMTDLHVSDNPKS